MSRRLSNKARVALVGEVFQAVYQRTESFERDNVGAYLAYLLGAICSGAGEGVEFSKPFTREQEGFLAMLHDSFPAEHDVWQFIDITNEPEVV